MRYTTLGGSNLRVSRLCLGTMMFGGKTPREEAVGITRRAVEAGVNFVDTANIYAGGACETILGEALEGIRDQVVLATKAGMRVGEGVNDEGISRWHFVRAVEASLKRLRTDRIDLMYIHWPMAAMNLEEILRTLDDLVRQGKVLYAACSNFPAWLWTRANWVAQVKGFVPLVCGQYPYNVIERGLEVEILPAAGSLGWGITVYRPLCVGVLTGKYLAEAGGVREVDAARGQQDERCLRWTKEYEAGLRKLEAFARERGYAMADAANAWILGHQAVTSVIVGVSKLSQLEENLRCVEWEMTAEEREAVSGMFDTAVWEEAGGKFPSWRRREDVGGKG